VLSRGFAYHEHVPEITQIKKGKKKKKKKKERKKISMISNNNLESVAKKPA